MKSKFRFFSLQSRLGKDKYASDPRILARLLSDEEGSHLLIVTLAIPVFIGLAGLATEGTLLFYNHRAVHSAADAAAYSAAIAYSIDDRANITTEAQGIVASYGFVVGTGNDQANVVAAVDTTTYSGLTAIDVTVTRPQLPFLSHIFVRNPFNVSSSAKAVISGGAGGGNGNCILSLAPTGAGIDLQGNPLINAPGCGVFSNSTSAGSIALGGNSAITAGSVGAAGTVTVGGSSNIGPPPNGYTSGDGKVVNPYANITVPSPSGSCITAPGGGNYHGTGSSRLTVTVPAGNYCSSIDVQRADVTLNPGTFSGGIDVSTFGSLTLNPGIYIFKGPVQFTVTSNSSLTGTGVTLVFTDPAGTAYPNGPGGSNTAMNIQSGATVKLQAPTTGDTEGMLIIGNSNIPLGTAFNLQANATAGSACTATNCVNGVVYLPTANFTWQGGPIMTGGCTQMIAYRVTLAGNATFDNQDCDSYGGGGGTGAKPIGNVVTLVR